ncbi:MAG: exodeoxyribonuclease III [Coriobacteriales bacterium]|jgi:exodeoxyribonuclease-3|nr:exodeoxyribonuclease III [Coriobacteriales bacterium]
MSTKMVSWNVNGFRAALKKGFYEVFDSFDADIFAIQETKLQGGQVTLDMPDAYHDYWSYADRKGYSGTAVFCKREPLQVVRSLGINAQDGTGLGLLDPRVLDTEGRICALEFDDYWFVCCYTPNAQDGLARIDLRMAWDAAFRRFVSTLDQDKAVIICGDLNVAHNEIDLKNFKSNRGNAGFSDEERADFNELLAAGFTDTFRHLYPERQGAYTWWSFRGNARANNTGWRIDYFLVSERLANSIQTANIYPEVTGSDHCPISLEMSL